MKASRDKQLQTLENAIIAMRCKIEEQIPVFKEAQLAQQVTVGTGESMLRQNPTVSEFRALVKDYGQAIKAYKELSDSNAEAESTNLDNIRLKFKVAK